MSALPFLTQAEIDQICEPLTQPGAQRRYLAEVLKLQVHEKPNGRPLVARSEFERVLGAERFGLQQSTPQNAPNVVGMMAHLEQRKKHGQKTQGR
ncbi:MULTISPECIES: hypothetical protein [Variovorax]|uniref:hypothetical protein n=1 Tax=Variovorax TaxID=34072 RepID=UPI0028548D14|nr:hypothetical protein [Variovorax sp. 3319]MDR6886083.1 hypothetical protein [Variovorax sp. 3319]